MFGLFKKLFKKKRRNIETWEIELLRNTIRQLPPDYKYLEQQLDMNLFAASLIGYSTLNPKYVGFSFNSITIEEIENRKEKAYKIEDIKVYDRLSNKYLNYTIHISDAVICGYTINGDEKYDIDVDQVDTSSFRKIYSENKDFDKLSKSLNPDDIHLLHPNEVYEVVLNGKSYYHILDLEDGNFIGMDLEKGIYRITHDPFSITLIELTLSQIFECFDKTA